MSRTGMEQLLASGTKGLVRWTVGPVSETGLVCLAHSVRSWRRLYADRFDLVICYNGMSPNHLRQFIGDEIPLLDQDNYRSSLPLSPAGPAWKLYPPRLRKNAREIFIDNDLVLYNKPEAIEVFLQKIDGFFVCEGLERCFGAFDAYVADGIRINTGLFGLPANFDFATALIEGIENAKLKNWTSHFDEQGLVAALLTNKLPSIISLGEISVCADKFSLGTCGMHIVGLNGGEKDHFWSQYTQEKLL